MRTNSSLCTRGVAVECVPPHDRAACLPNRCRDISLAWRAENESRYCCTLSGELSLQQVSCKQGALIWHRSEKCSVHACWRCSAQLQEVSSFAHSCLPILLSGPIFGVSLRTRCCIRFCVHIRLCAVLCYAKKTRNVRLLQFAGFTYHPCLASSYYSNISQPIALSVSVAFCLSSLSHVSLPHRADSCCCRPTQPAVWRLPSSLAHSLASSMRRFAAIKAKGSNRHCSSSKSHIHHNRIACTRYARTHVHHSFICCFR